MVKLGAERYSVTKSKAKRLGQVAFVFDGNMIMGIEQNPKTKSRWAQMVRSGKKAMQFIQDGRYVAVVFDGKVTLYGKRTALSHSAGRLRQLKVILLENSLHLFSRQGCSDTPLQDHDKSPVRFR